MKFIGPCLCAVLLVLTFFAALNLVGQIPLAHATWTQVTLPYTFSSSGNYQVTSVGDLSSSRAFTITTSNVTIDFQNLAIVQPDNHQIAQITGNNIQLWNASFTVSGSNTNAIGLYFLSWPNTNVTLNNITGYNVPYFEYGDITGMTINYCHFTNLTNPFLGTILNANLLNSVINSMPNGFGFSPTNNTYVGNLNCNATGLTFQYANNTLIENCVITNTTVGIDIEHSVNSTVQDMNFNRITQAIGAGHSTNFVASHIVANNSFLTLNYGVNMTADYVESDNVTGTNGVSCEYDNGLNVTDCTMQNDGWTGIHADHSTNAYIHNNTVVNCNYGITLHGGNNTIYDDNTVTACTTDYYIMDYFGVEFPYNITISNNRGYGGSGTWGVIRTTQLTTDFDNIAGITIFNNIFANGTDAAFHSTNLTNILFYNNLINGTYTFDSPVSGSFNTTQQAGTRIYGSGTQIGGNFWATPSHTGYGETGTDNNNDGFVDSPYQVVTGLYDYLPLSLNYISLLPVTLTIFSASGGSTSPIAGTYTNHNSGNTVTIYETNSSGYNWSNWLVNGTSGGSTVPLVFKITGNTTVLPVFSLTTVTVTITTPSNTTYATGSIPVNFTGAGGTIDNEWFNCKNGTSWIYPSNQTYTTPTSMTGFNNGASYTDYEWVNNTVGTIGTGTVMFSVSTPSSSHTSGPQIDMREVMIAAILIICLVGIILAKDHMTHRGS